MVQLIKSEIHKIFYRKVTWIGIALLLLLNLGSVVSSDLLNADPELQLAQKYEGILDDEKVRRMLDDFTPSKEDLAKWQGISVVHIGLNSMQSAVHAYFANTGGTWNGKSVEDVFGLQDIRVGFHSGWFEFSQMLTRLLLALGCLMIVITAPVFSSEYGGADSLILTTRYGRTKCGLAKILAAYLTAAFLTAILLAGNFAAVLSAYGTSGLDSSVLFSGEFYNQYMAFNISCGTMLLYQAILAFSGILMLTGITVCISAACRTQTAALAASALAFLFPLLFSVPKTSPLFKYLHLLPIHHIEFSTLMSIKQWENNMLFAILGVPVSLLTAALGAAAAYRIFARHQAA